MHSCHRNSRELEGQHRRQRRNNHNGDTHRNTRNVCGDRNSRDGQRSQRRRTVCQRRDSLRPYRRFDDALAISTR
jgi:hypothetical protein